jgi:hypothetical protein
MNNFRLGITLVVVGSVYCAILAAGNLFIYDYQKHALYDDLERQQSAELNMLAELAQEGLLTQNYAFIEWFINRWGSEYHKVVELSLENKRGLVLFEYQRAVPARTLVLSSQRAINMYDGSYLVKLSTDTIALQQQLDEMLVQLLLVSTVAVFLLVIALWVAFYKLALQPINAEIARRKHAEDLLHGQQATD